MVWQQAVSFTKTQGDVGDGSEPTNHREIDMLRLFAHYIRRGYGPRIAYRLARGRMRESA